MARKYVRDLKGRFAKTGAARKAAKKKKYGASAKKANPTQKAARLRRSARRNEVAIMAVGVASLAAAHAINSREQKNLAGSPRKNGLPSRTQDRIAGYRAVGARQSKPGAHTTLGRGTLRNNVRRMESQGSPVKTPSKNPAWLSSMRADMAKTATSADARKAAATISRIGDKIASGKKLTDMDRSMDDAARMILARYDTIQQLGPYRTKALPRRK